MHDSHEKGTTVTPIEHSQKTPRNQTGFLAMLRDVLCGRGRGGRSAGRTRLISLALLAIGALVLLLAVVAFAGNEDFKIKELLVSEVNATRALVSFGAIRGGSEPAWRVEYATSMGGPWTPAQSFKSEAAALEGRQYAEIDQLVPGKHYYVRVVGSTSGSSTESTTELTTTAVSPPVFFDPHEAIYGANGSDGSEFVAPPCARQYQETWGQAFCVITGLVTQTAGPSGLATEVYANGSDTTYHFEDSSSSPSGPWTVVPGASGSVSAAEEFKVAEVKLEGLTPETTYYVRGVAENAVAPATISASLKFTTHTARAQASFGAGEVQPAASSARLLGSVSPNGFETHWRFEYATSSSGPWSDGPEGAIPQSEAAYSEEGQRVEASLAGLSSATHYYVRLFVENESEPGVPAQSTTEAVGFETSGPPTPLTFATHALHGEALRLLGYLTPNNTDLDEVQKVTIGGGPTGGTFTLTSAGQSVTGTATAALTAGSTAAIVNLGPGAEVQLREADERLMQAFRVGKPISGVGIPPGTTVSVGPPLRGERLVTLTLSQPAIASGSAVTLSAGLAKLPFNASFQEVQSALRELSGYEGNIEVNGPDGGPYTVEFIQAKADLNVPALEADASGLTPSGTVTVATAQEGSSYATHYRFEYVDQRHFESEGGFASAATKSTPEAHFEGVEGGYVGADLPELEAGESYRYRLTASNATPGNPVVHGEEQTLSVPSEPEATAEGSCPNEALRTGPSAKLPDCRAYEQLTPHDKEGSEEIFHALEYRLENSGVVIGEDGDHVAFDGQFVHWGSAGGSPYFFTRTANGWQTTPGTPQPEAGIDSHYLPELYSPDLTQFAFSAGWNTGTAESPNLEFKAGPSGGPYADAASVSREQLRVEDGHIEDGWVAASEDFSNLIFATEDHTFIPHHATGTASGSDLYEYSQGELRQLNVSSGSPGATIGSCGAEVAMGAAEKRFSHSHSTRHSVSKEGQRVFFYAVPSGTCSEPRHLYMRTDGAETTDLGTDELLAANAAGTEALLVAQSGETEEVLLYDTESHTSTLLFVMSSEEVRPWSGGAAPGFAVSEDLGTIYIATAQHLTLEAPPAGGLYRYDVPAKTLRFVLAGARVQYLSPDGRYVYFEGETPTLPAKSEQVLRYDSVEKSIECVSCASPFDPEPKHSAGFTDDEDNPETKDATPGETIASANGDYVFFTTISRSSRRTSTAKWN